MRKKWKNCDDTVISPGIYWRSSPRRQLKWGNCPIQTWDRCIFNQIRYIYIFFYKSWFGVRRRSGVSQLVTDHGGFSASESNVITDVPPDADVNLHSTGGVNGTCNSIAYQTNGPPLLSCKIIIYKPDSKHTLCSIYSLLKTPQTRTKLVYIILKLKGREAECLTYKKWLSPLNMN